jgi:all-trans-8'-apo-beta-carotenal 15,15'-oxygenase
LTPQYQSHFYIVNFWSTAMSANEQLVSGPASPPDGPVLEAIFGGLQREHDFVPLRVDGRLPADLRGTLFRNGPAVFTAGRNPHWFDGTGAITAVRVDGVEAFGAVRVVHTPSADHDAGRADNRYSGFLQKMSWGQRVRAFAGGQAARNTASINVLPWQQRLFALMETTLPLEVDRVTLRSLGETDLHGVIPKGWNAHPHYVPARRTTYQFGLRIGPKVFLDVFALPDSGGAQRLASLALPGVMEAHDFFATDNHLVFVLPPLWCTRCRCCGRAALPGHYAGDPTHRPKSGSFRSTIRNVSSG